MNYKIDTSHKKSGSPFGIIILILLVLGGGAYAYYKYFLVNNLQNQTNKNATMTQNTDISNTINNSVVTDTSTSSSTSDNTQDIKGIYKNTKFGYQITLGSNWYIPVKATKVYDLMSDISSSTTKDEFTNSYNQWTPNISTNITISDASLSDENAFYNKVNSDNQMSQFPGNIINISLIHSGNSTKNIVATTTPTRIISKITVNNKYSGVITTIPGKPLVIIQVDFTSSGKLSDGAIPDRIVFSSMQVSAADLLKIVNTLVY
jgi:hypothetical protein